MRITILCNKDLASCVALNYLVPALKAHELTVFVSARVGKQGSTDTTPADLQELKFYEQQLFNDILFPLLAASHGKKPTQLRSFSRLAEQIGKPIAELNSPNQGEGLARLQEQAPELIMSIRYGAILKETVLALPTLGVLNLHSGRLPDYKGVMATFRALLQGDSTIGTTLHWIDDSSIDTGRIVGTTTLPVSPGRSYLWHVLALYEAGCRLMADTVGRLARNESIPSQAQPRGGSYYSFPTARELAAFRARGWQLVQVAEIEALTRQFMS